MEKKPSLAVPALIATVLSWGSIPLFLKYFTSYLDAWTVNGVRYIIGALLLLPVLRGVSVSGRGRSSVWRDALVPSLVNGVSQAGFALMATQNPPPVATSKSPT